MGLASVALRETSCYIGSNRSEHKDAVFLSFCAVLNKIFIFIGAGIFLFIICITPYLSGKWFNYVDLTQADVSFCLVIMAFFIVCKWMSGLYKAVITGVENFRIIAFINIFVVSVRYVFVIPVFYFYRADIKIFFLIQLVAVFFETLLLYHFYKGFLPKAGEFSYKDGFHRLKSLVGFSSQAGVVSLLYVIVTQVDKLYLSKTLKLDVYGVFSFSIVFATLLNMFAAPIQHVLQPRLVKVFSNFSRELFYEYFKSTFIVFSLLMMYVTGAVILSIKTVLIFMSYSLENINTVLDIARLYLLGNAFFLISSMSFFMQYAQGGIRYHLLGQVFFCLIYGGAVLFFSDKYTYLATGGYWLFLNFIYVLLWLPFVNSKCMPEYKVKVFTCNLIYIVMLPIFFIMAINFLIVSEYTDTWIVLAAKLLASNLIYFVFYILFYKKILITNFKVFIKV